MLKSTQPSTSLTSPSELNFPKFVRNVALATLAFFIPSAILLAIVTQRNFSFEEAVTMVSVHALLTIVSFALVVPVGYKFYALAKNRNKGDS